MMTLRTHTAKTAAIGGVGALSAFLLLFAGSATAQAQGLRNLSSLQSVTFYERTGDQRTANYALGGGTASSALTTTGSFDFSTDAGDEAYDFYLSNADGTLNVNGSYLSILARFSPTNDVGGNIDAVALNFSGGVTEYANIVVGYSPSAGATLDDIAAQGYSANALGAPDTFSTGIARGGTGRLTVGFASSAPEPGTLALVGLGLIPLGRLRRRSA